MNETLNSLLNEVIAKAEKAVQDNTKLSYDSYDIKEYHGDTVPKDVYEVIDDILLHNENLAEVIVSLIVHITYLKNNN